MPEGAELKISSDFIKDIIVNKTIINIYPSKNGRYASKEISGFQKCLNFLPLKVESVNVKGKFMYWKLSGVKNIYLFCTYGMTGQWSLQESKHTCFTVQYFEDDNGHLKDQFIYFNDPRHFGTIKFGTEEELEDKLFSLGWDPLEEDLKNKFYFIKNKISKSKKSIGEVLLDQKIFAGCGNYVRAEALYRAEVNPWIPAKSLDDVRLLNLCNHVKDVLNESYQAQGASFKSYINANGNAGKYSFNFQVYGQNEDPLGNQIKKEPMGTRTIHWCPVIQKV